MRCYGVLQQKPNPIIIKVTCSCIAKIFLQDLTLERLITLFLYEAWDIERSLLKVELAAVYYVKCGWLKPLHHLINYNAMLHEAIVFATCNAIMTQDYTNVI